MKTKKQFRRWRQRQRKLLADLERLGRQCRKDGTVEQVHLLRVTLRRLRLSVRVGKALLDETAVTTFRTWARRISKQTSHVRDLDVALEWIAQQAGGEAAAARCAQRRNRLWQVAQRRLPALPAKLLPSLAGADGGVREARRLARRFRRLEGRYEAELREATPRFFALSPEAQHEFRRTLRWWRYLRELELPTREQEEDRLLQCLVRAQEATGDRQNLALAEAALKAVRSGAPVAELLHSLRSGRQAQRARIRKALTALARLRKWDRLGRRAAEPG